MPMIKDIMVHLDGTTSDPGRLDHAEALSAQLGHARITGLYTNVLPEYAYVLGVQSEFADMGPVLELEQVLRREGDRVIAALGARINGPGTLNEIRRIDAWPSQIPEQAAAVARCMDLVIATAPGRDTAANWKDLVEAMLFHGGCGLYLVPPGCPIRQNLRTVLFAWKDTVEAAHALHASLPLLRTATRVCLLAVDDADDKDLPAQMFDVAAHLDRHGVAVDVAVVPKSIEPVSQIIRSEAARIGADVIALGAYGHSRLRETILGGVTRDLMADTTLPLLLAH